MLACALLSFFPRLMVYFSFLQKTLLFNFIYLFIRKEPLLIDQKKNESKVNVSEWAKWEPSGSLMCEGNLKWISAMSPVHESSGGCELITCTPLIKTGIMQLSIWMSACLIRSLKPEFFQEGRFSPSFIQIQEHVGNYSCRLMSLTCYPEWIFIPGASRWRWCNIEQKGKRNAIKPHFRKDHKGNRNLRPINYQKPNQTITCNRCNGKHVFCSAHQLKSRKSKNETRNEEILQSVGNSRPLVQCVPTVSDTSVAQTAPVSF